MLCHMIKAMAQFIRWSRLQPAVLWTPLHDHRSYSHPRVRSSYSSICYPFAWVSGSRSQVVLRLPYTSNVCCLPGRAGGLPW